MWDIWEDIKDFMRYDFPGILFGGLLAAALVGLIVVCIEFSMTAHFEREFAREHGYYPTKTTIMDERSE